LIHEDIYDAFLEKALDRVKKIKSGHPLDTETMVGAQASEEQLKKILNYIDLGKHQAKLLVGGDIESVPGAAGYYVKPTVFEGPNYLVTLFFAAEHLGGCSTSSPPKY